MTRNISYCYHYFIIAISLSLYLLGTNNIQLSIIPLFPVLPIEFDS